MRTISDLDRHLAEFTTAFEARGGKVLFARTAEEANEYIVGVCRRAEAKLVAKSKSMASEEIRVNEALEAAGIRPVECDLGEYILQLANEHPIHIILPAIEKTAADVAELFSAVEGAPVSPGPGRACRRGPPAAPRDLPERGRRAHRRQFRGLETGSPVSSRTKATVAW